ncbi:MAG TPA: hypothetical protein H9664_00115, partial [Firmicutes bacterium]|nr:hypothetical protein [Bacillota bacterium]
MRRGAAFAAEYGRLGRAIGSALGQAKLAQTPPSTASARPFRPGRNVSQSYQKVWQAMPAKPFGMTG